MKYPDFLKAKGKIGFIAPSYGATTEPYKSLFDSAQKFFSAQNYELVLGPNCYKNSGVGKSNTAIECGKEINDFFCNNRSNVIISCGGGETMCEDLPFVDFESISKSEPKWFMGYSDNTNLTFLLPTLCDTAAIYGPCAGSFGQKPMHIALKDALELLKGEKLSFDNYKLWELQEDPNAGVLSPYNCTEEFNMQVYIGKTKVNETSVSGRLLGGCLDCLDIICGTKFDKVKDFNRKYRKDGTLWFLESCEYDPMGVRRALWHLKNAGWFDTAKGFLIGRPMRFNDKFMDLDHTTAVIDMLSEFNIPILTNLDIGHLPPMIPVIEGSIGNVKALNGAFNITYNLL